MPVAYADANKQPAVPPPDKRANEGQITNRSREKAAEARAMFSFAPMWNPVPRFPPDPGAETAVPSASYAMIWQPQWQAEIGLSAQQRETLKAVKEKAFADAQQRAEQFSKLSLEEQQEQVKARAAKPAPRDEVRQQIESVLTPTQLQTLRDYSFPEHAVALLYSTEIRHEIGFGVEQQDRMRHLVREKLARSQDVCLNRADNVWRLLSPQQQAELPAVVKQQGPTSAVLSIAWELGFDMDAIGFSHPMLTEVPVRKRLALDAEQEKRLEALLAASVARRKVPLNDVEKRNAEIEEGKQVEAILSRAQLTMLKEINFRREVVLALSYPEKRELVGITDQQSAEFQRLESETHKQLYRIDRELLGKVLEILTPTQQSKLKAERDRRIGG